MELSFAAVICAAGSSKRMGGIKKEYLQLKTAEKPLTVLDAVVNAFASCPRIEKIIIAVPPAAEKEDTLLRAVSSENKSRVFPVHGGSTRRASVYNALKFLSTSPVSHVLIHDGARPWIKQSLIERVMEAAVKYGAVIPALPLIETPKELYSPLVLSNEAGSAAGNGEGEAVFIKRHLRRAELCAAQTPQGFKFPEILRAHEKANEKEDEMNRSQKMSFEYTDDAEVWAEFIGQVAVIPGDTENRKITYPEDINFGSGE